RLEREAHVLRVDRADHDDRRRRLRHDPPGGLEAVQLRHVDVHGDDVRLQLGGERDGLFTVARLAYDLQPGIAVDDRKEQGPGDDRVLGHQYPQARHGAQTL